MKSCGGEFSMPSDHRFNVSVDANSPARLSAGRVPVDRSPWNLHSLDPFTKAVAAVVCPRNSQPSILGGGFHLDKPSDKLKRHASF